MGTLIYPKKVVKVTQLYDGEKHKGLDIGGTFVGDLDVVSIGDGIVTEVSDWGNLGNHVGIYYPDENKTALYAHLKSIDVEMGQSVTQGQLIGLEGNTGKSTGPHLHFGLYEGRYESYYKNALNPVDFLSLGQGQYLYKGEGTQLLKTLPTASGMVELDSLMGEFDEIVEKAKGLNKTQLGVLIGSVVLGLIALASD